MSEATSYEESANDGMSGEPVHIAAILERVHLEALFPGPLLLCLVTGEGPGSFFEPMPRFPSPPVGDLFDDGFPGHLRAALALNPAIHDGAIIVRRIDISSQYRIDGWSYRLIAPFSAHDRGSTNRGSAYNSCLAASAVDGVDATYLLSRGRLTQFVGGSEINIVQI